MAIGNGIPAIVPTMAAQKPPISSCPLAPMLNRPALKPTATERPVKISGVAALRVFAIALGLPRAPSSIAPYAVIGSVRSSVWLGPISPEMMMRIAPASRPSRMATAVTTNWRASEPPRRRDVGSTFIVPAPGIAGSVMPTPPPVPWP